MVPSYIALLDKIAKSMRKENTPMSNCKGITLTKQKVIVGKATTVVNLGVGILSSNSELAYLEVRLINVMSHESILKAYANEAKKDYH